MFSRLALAAVALVLSVPAASAVPTTARPSDLDRSFGDQGVTTVDAGGSEILGDLAVQTDGSVVGVGTSQVGAESDGVVFRLRPDGRRDRRFGTRRLNIGAEDRGRAVALQADGRIVVAGDTRRGSTSAVSVHRLLPNGDPDLSFSNDGRVVIDLPTPEEASDVTITPDNRIVVVGWTATPTGARVTLHRLLPSGLPDSSLDGDGSVTLGITNSEGGDAVAVQPDGKILVGGRAASSGFLILYRRNVDGSPDLGFGTAGYAAVPTGAEGAGIIDLAMDRQGRILLAGNLYTATSRDALLARVTPEGVADPTFGSGGLAQLDLGFEENFSSVQLTADGRVVTGGTVDAGSAFVPVVARWTTSGELDPSFTPRGWATYPDSRQTNIDALAVQPDGRYLVGGDTGTNPGTGVDVAVTRLLGGKALVCGGRPVSIAGTAGADTLRGTPRADVIAGLGGADRIRGLGGNDVLCGGGGNDRLDGGAGRDRLIGGAGRDITHQ